MDLGSKIKNIRIEKNITSKELASLSNITTVELSKIENGNVNTPHICTLIKIANALEIDLKKLLSED